MRLSNGNGIERKANHFLCTVARTLGREIDGQFPRVFIQKRFSRHRRFESHSLRQRVCSLSAFPSLCAKSFAAKITVGKWRAEKHSSFSDLYSQAVNKTCDARMRSSRFCGIICLDAVAGGGCLSSLP